MSLDYTKLLSQIHPQKDGADHLSIRTSVVSAVNADGTVDLTMSGATVPNVPRLSSAPVAVGTVVQVLSLRGSLLVLGPVAGSTGGASSSRAATTTRTTNSSAVTAETVVDTVTANLVIGRIYKVVWSTGYSNNTAADTTLLRIRDTNLAGALLTVGRYDSRLTNVAGSRWVARLEVEYTAVATGAKTFATTIQDVTGGGNTTAIIADATYPSYLYVDYVRG